MRLFEFLFAEDDLAVLAAYAVAQEIAEAARRSQPQGERSQPLSAAAFDEAAELDEGLGEDGESTQELKSAPRRTHIWVQRLRVVDGILPDRMAPIHGRLIAHGLLQFQLQGRDEGVVYRVTSAGRQKLNPPAAEAA
jgi:hypothetical protein